jgi:hypothetical protein
LPLKRVVEVGGNAKTGEQLHANRISEEASGYDPLKPVRVLMCVRYLSAPIVLRPSAVLEFDHKQAKRRDD